MGGLKQIFERFILLLLLFQLTLAPAFGDRPKMLSIGLPNNVFKSVKPVPESRSDLHSNTLSPDAVQLVEILGLTERLKKYQDLHNRAESIKPAKMPGDDRQDMRDLHDEILDVIEHTRLEIDFTVSEIRVEEAEYNEILRVFMADRDMRVNRINAAGFRWNGALWAVAEGLDIPTYRQPRYSIPSGSIGIIAGLVPSIFSLYALKESSGEKFKRPAKPNMLSKLFGYPVTPQLEIPDSIWSYITAVPPQSAGNKARFEILKSRWLSDQNLTTYTDPTSKKQLDQLTGSVEEKANIQLLSDRLTMLNQMSAMIVRMNRLLLEIHMILQGRKEI
jgi:hypothetical protein